MLSHVWSGSVQNTMTVNIQLKYNSKSKSGEKYSIIVVFHAELNT